MDPILLEVKGLSYSQTQSGAYALILGEADGQRRLPIIIGAFEAQAIAIALEKEVQPPRPLTHDLFKSMARSFNIGLKEVLIHKLQEGIFFAHLVLTHGDHEEIVDARTSDAVALALRFKCPIYTYEHIMQKAGVLLEDKQPEPELPETPIEKEPTRQNPRPRASSAPKSNLERATLEKLHALLEKAVADEDYETAARIRDEISKREQP